MPYVRFHDHFPDIAEAETRNVIVLHDSDWNLPAGNYVFVEMFCDEPRCDCRRVFLCVISEERKKVEAYIAYGWENPAYYRKWLGYNDVDAIKDLKGPVLNVGSPQSNWAPAILKLFRDVLLRDNAYIERIKQHYRIFRDAMDGNQEARH